MMNNNEDKLKKQHKVSHHVLQHISKQDFTISGVTEDFSYIIVADSHGGLRVRKGDWFTNLFTSIDWCTYLVDDNWQENLMTICNTIETRNIGSTFTCVKITPQKFEVTWIGDSSAKIYNKLSGELVWETKDHNYDNEEDICSIKGNRQCSITSAWDIQATRKSRMTSKLAKSFDYIKVSECCNMTRCLGHRGYFCWKTDEKQLQFEKVNISRNANTQYKIVTGSDGFWQVMSPEETSFIVENDAEILATTAREKWEQSWEHDNMTGIITKDMHIPRHNWDDVAVATWSE